MSRARRDDRSSVAQAYSASGRAWQTGAGPVYDVLGDRLVASAVVDRHDLALDLGAGTGAASRALRRRGARVVAADIAIGMLEQIDDVATSVVADARLLPFASASFDVVVAAFSLNHVTDPVEALLEVSRVLRRGGRFAASVYATDDDHPVKAAVESVAAGMGWRRPAWFEQIRTSTMPQLASVDRARAALRQGGLDGDAELVEIEFPDLSPNQLIEWRLGMAHLAPFVDSLTVDEQVALRRAARLELGPVPEVLIRRVVHLHALR